jgi:hypothetical protein
MDPAKLLVEITDPFRALVSDPFGRIFGGKKPRINRLRKSSLFTGWP